MCRLAILLASIALPISASNITIFEGAGYPQSAYQPTWQGLQTEDEREICVAHSSNGAANAAAAFVLDFGRCEGGLVFLGACPPKSFFASLKKDTVRNVLVIAGDLDGVWRLSHFAAARHQFSSSQIRFVVAKGFSHHSFVPGSKRPSALIVSNDLRPSISSADASAVLVSLLKDFVGQPASADMFSLEEGEAIAAQIAQPLVDALKLEGSAALGTQLCNSDFPTNPSCNYPKYPDFSLPFGPSPAPSPLPPVDCVCGSRWVADYANPLVSGAAEKGFAVTTADAFHDVSDEHPFHLPNIWNECDAPAGCTLNMTTLTMPWLEAGALFPNASSPPLSAFELRAKIKSRQTVWEAAGLGPQDAGTTDKNNFTFCRLINEQAYEWALTHAEASVRARFEADGEPLVMVDDKEATIGITGPQWIQDKLVYTRVDNADTSRTAVAGTNTHIEIQSWTFVVSKAPISSKYIPDGMHYCKLLSPARAMEWIYTDALRAGRSWTS